MAMAGGEVDRCVCANVTLAEMKAIADVHPGADLDFLRQRVGCARGCSLCVPYIRAMLTTGRTAFAVDDPVLKQPPSSPGPPTL